MAPGDGPGHTTWWLRYDDDEGQEMKSAVQSHRNDYGSENILIDAILDMMLLGECNHLLCNVSSLSYYAKQFKKVPFTELFSDNVPQH